MEYLYHELTKKIIAAGIEVHRALGPGLLEQIYHKCFLYELKEVGLEVKSEVALPLKYKNLSFDLSYRLDLIVEDLIILELKTVEAVSKLHKSQLLTYLKLADKKLGMIVNFNSKTFSDGIARVINADPKCYL